MSEVDELGYTLREVRSFLPTGWSLVTPVDDAWQEERNAWVATVRDGSDLDWEVEVSLQAARAAGRSEALRAAMSRLVRRR